MGNSNWVSHAINRLAKMSRRRVRAVRAGQPITYRPSFDNMLLPCLVDEMGCVDAVPSATTARRQWQSHFGRTIIASKETDKPRTANRRVKVVWRRNTHETKQNKTKIFISVHRRNGWASQRDAHMCSAKIPWLDAKFFVNTPCA